MKHNITCPICDKVFASSKKRVYCSLFCYYTARRNGTYAPPWLGKKRDPHTVRKQAEALKRRYQSGELKVWCEGKKLTEEHKKKLSLAKKGRYVGDRHPNWKGGKHHSHSGYQKVWLGTKKRQYEHILVMEQIIGRKLRKGEVVHHKDGNPANNNPSNLMLFESNAAHLRYHRDVLGMKIKNQYSR